MLTLTSPTRWGYSFGHFYYDYVRLNYIWKIFRTSQRTHSIHMMKTTPLIIWFCYQKQTTHMPRTLCRKRCVSYCCRYYVYLPLGVKDLLSFHWLLLAVSHGAGWHAQCYTTHWRCDCVILWWVQEARGQPIEPEGRGLSIETFDESEAIVGVLLTLWNPAVYVPSVFITEGSNVLPTQCIYVFCADLRTNSNYFLIQYWLIGFCKRDGLCLLRGTDLIFLRRSLPSRWAG